MKVGTETLQGGFLRDRLKDVEERGRQVRALVTPLGAEELHRRPASGGWSIAEVLEHLVISNADYFGVMRPRIAAAAASQTRDRGDAWRPRLAGRVLAHSLRNVRPGRMKSPAAWRPDQVRPDVVDAFFQSQGELIELIRASEGLDLNRVGAHSPISRLIRLNLGDCFLLMTLHEARHLEQMRRVRS